MNKGKGREVPTAPRTTTETTSTLGESSEVKFSIGAQIATSQMPTRRATKWQPIFEQLPSISEGMALPVHFENQPDAAYFQSCVLSRNAAMVNGTKYRAQRIGTTVYVSRIHV